MGESCEVEAIAPILTATFTLSTCFPNDIKFANRNLANSLNDNKIGDHMYSDTWTVK